MKKQIKKAGNFVIKNWKPITAGILVLLGAAAGLDWKYQKQAKKALEKAPEVIEKIAENTNRIDRL